MMALLASHITATDLLCNHAVFLSPASEWVTHLCMRLERSLQRHEICCRYSADPIVRRLPRPVANKSHPPSNP